MSDPIDEAIAAAEQPTLVMRRWQVTISSTGRPAAVVLPADCTDAELAEFAGWLLSAVLNTYRAERTQGAASRIVIPGRA